MSQRPRHGCLRGLLGVALVGVAVVYGLAALTSPWSFHIGGRWTPFLYWSGHGTLVTSTGNYPLYIYLFPSSHFSRLRLDGLRPTGGLGGGGALCTAPGVVQPLKLGGTIYGQWTSTDDSLMAFRLLERRVFNHQREAYFNLYGRWHGGQLVMDDRGGYASRFPSGVKIEHASITLDWGSYSEFKTMCQSFSNTVPHK